MNILVDTHILLWALAQPKKLKPMERRALLAPDAVIFVSTVSLWEISLKYQLGKIRIQPFDIDVIMTGIQRSGYSVVTVSADEAISFCRLPHLANTDPFDRLLMWQAICNHYYFMSRDSNVELYKKFGLKLITA